MNTKAFLLRLREKADRLAYNAGMSGEMSDGGAGELKRQIAIYEAGLRHEIPYLWYDEYNKFTTESDPEYAEFLRLKIKFGE